MGHLTIEPFFTGQGIDRLVGLIPVSARSTESVRHDTVLTLAAHGWGFNLSNAVSAAGTKTN